MHFSDALEKIVGFAGSSFEFLKEEAYQTALSLIPVVRLADKRKRNEDVTIEDWIWDALKIGVIASSAGEVIGINTTPFTELPELFQNSPHFWMRNLVLYAGVVALDGYRNLRMQSIRYNEYMQKLASMVHINGQRNFVEKAIDFGYNFYRDSHLFVDHMARNIYAIAYTAIGFIANNIFNIFDIKYKEEMARLLDTTLTNPSTFQHYFTVFGFSKAPSDAARNRHKINGTYDQDMDGFKLEYEIKIALAGFIPGTAIAVAWEYYESGTDMGTSEIDTVWDLFVGLAAASTASGKAFFGKSIGYLKSVPMKIMLSFETYLHKFSKQDLYYGLQPPDRVKFDIRKDNARHFL